MYHHEPHPRLWVSICTLVIFWSSTCTLMFEKHCCGNCFCSTSSPLLHSLDCLSVSRRRAKVMFSHHCVSISYIGPGTRGYSIATGWRDGWMDGDINLYCLSGRLPVILSGCWGQKERERSLSGTVAINRFWVLCEVVYLHYTIHSTENRTTQLLTL